MDKAILIETIVVIAAIISLVCILIVQRADRGEDKPNQKESEQEKDENKKKETETDIEILNEEEIPMPDDSVLINFPKDRMMCIDNILPLNSAGHLRNYINYLFRADRAQKNTNEDTPQNLAAFLGKEDHLYAVGEIHERRKAANLLYKTSMDGHENDKVDHLAMRIAYMYGKGAEEVMHLDHKDKEEVMRCYIHYRLNRPTPGWKVLCFADHSDQGQFHIHELLMKEEKHGQPETIMKENNTDKK